jgi:hypothetical protein
MVGVSAGYQNVAKGDPQLILDPAANLIQQIAGHAQHVAGKQANSFSTGLHYQRRCSQFALLSGCPSRVDTTTDDHAVIRIDLKRRSPHFQFALSIGQTWP